MKTHTIIALTLLQVLIVFLAIVIFIAPAAAQKPSAKPSPTKPTPERSREIVVLLNEGRLAAPELAVDTFLRVLEAKKVTDPVWRKEIIDEAQRMINDVQHAMPMQLAFGKPRELNDTEAYIQAAVSRRKFDRLSFQSRLISLILEVGPSRARQMIFQVGGDLGLKPRHCEDVLTYVPDDIYIVATKAASASFTERQIAEGQRALFLLPWVENLVSPTQILPVLNIVKQMQGSPAERQLLLNALSKAIDRNFKDDRSFTHALKTGNLAVQINKIVVGNVDPWNAGLVTAYRAMLLKNLRGGRCADNIIEKGARLPEYIDAANKIFPDKPLTGEDLIASEVMGTAKPIHLFVKSKGANVLRSEGTAAMGLKIVDNELVKNDQKDAEWISRVNSFTDKLLAFEGSDGETETELLILKSSYLGALLGQALDPGELRRNIVRKYLQLLVRSPLQKTDFVHWLFWVKGAETFAPDDFAEIAPELPNQNIKVLLAIRKLGISDDKKVSEQPRK